MLCIEFRNLVVVTHEYMKKTGAVDTTIVLEPFADVGRRIWLKQRRLLMNSYLTPEFALKRLSPIWRSYFQPCRHQPKQCRMHLAGPCHAMTAWKLRWGLQAAMAAELGIIPGKDAEGHVKHQ